MSRTDQNVLAVKNKNDIWKLSFDKLDKMTTEDICLSCQLNSHFQGHYPCHLLTSY